MTGKKGGTSKGNCVLRVVLLLNSLSKGKGWFKNANLMPKQEDWETNE